MRETAKVTLDGLNYELGEWDVDKALDILTWLFKTVGGPAAAALVGAKDAKAVLEADVEATLGNAIMQLATQMRNDEVKTYMRKIVGEDILTFPGGKINYDMHFKGKIGHMFKLAVQVVRYQYADFLDVLPVEKLVAMGQARATTQATSTQAGTSGAQ